MYHPSYVIVGERLSKYCAYIHPLQTMEHELAFHSFFFVLSFITLYVPVHSPHEGSSLQAPLCPPPRPVPRRYKAYQGIHTGKTKESAKESRPHIRLLFCRGHERGSGKEERLLPVSGTRFLCVHPPLLFPFLPGVRTPTPRSVRLPQPGAGTSLPTAAAERKSKIGWLQRSSAKRSRILNRSLPFPVSLCTSAHKLFCWHSRAGST